MAAPKWKYAKPKKAFTESPYLYLDKDKETELVFTGWNFDKNTANDSLFNCDVIEKDGSKIDKLWTVWDYELKEQLLKILKGKDPIKDKVKIKITKHEEDMEESYELKEVKK